MICGVNFHWFELISHAGEMALYWILLSCHACHDYMPDFLCQISYCFIIVMGCSHLLGASLHWIFTSCQP